MLAEPSIHCAVLELPPKPRILDRTLLTQDLLSQVIPSPLNPALQAQVKEPGVSLQVALPLQGLLAHSSISKEGIEL
jgi:hypothetical protein